MHHFDEWLRDALMDANLLQFEKVLAEAGAQSFDFSPKYLRERTRMLADPFGWARRRGRSARNRAARSAACVLLACTLAFGALMAASPTVRAAVLNWLREFGGDSVTYTTNPYVSQRAPEGAALQDWQVTWLPEGYTLWDLYATPTFSKWFFLSDETGDSLDFGCSTPAGNSQVQIGTVPDPEGVREQINVHGCAADYYAGGGEQLLVWETPEGFLLRLLAQGSMDRETLLKIAESAACYRDDTPAYEMGWVPPDFHDMDSPRGNGAFRQEWVRFWASPEEPEVSEGPDNSVTQFGDITMTVGTAPGEETTSTLMWEDPETGAAFCLRGELEKSDLLRMAESVRRRETPVEPVQPGSSKTVTETAGGDAP